MPSKPAAQAIQQSDAWICGSFVSDRVLWIYRLNVLHWHQSDTQSFPFQSKTSPLLDKEGAYSSQERYTQADIADVIEYARERGVRVMVEFDMPVS